MNKYEIRFMYEGELNIDYCYGSDKKQAVREFYYYNPEDAIILTIVKC